MDEEYYGWIPILSGELLVGEKLFRNTEDDDFKGVIPKEEKAVISDNRFERLFHKHKISNELIGFEKCTYCQEYIFQVNIKVSDRKNEKLVAGKAFIHRNGLVRYIIDFNKEHEQPEKVLHVLIRDYFHTHSHHSSDLPFPPVEASDENSGKNKLMELYIAKFKEYKSVIGKVKIKKATEDISRALGEITYAKSCYNCIDPGYKELMKSFGSFQESFKVAGKRASEKLHLSTTYFAIALTTALIGLGWFQFYLLSKATILTVLEKSSKTSPIAMFAMEVLPDYLLSLSIFHIPLVITLTVFLYAVSEASLIRQKIK